MPTKARSESVDPSVKVSQRQPAKPTMAWASTTLISRRRAGSCNTVKLRSRPVRGSDWPKGTANRAGNQRLQPLANAVADPARAAARAIRKVVRGQRSRGISKTIANPTNSRGGRSAKTGIPVITWPLKGAAIKSRACTIK